MGEMTMSRSKPLFTSIVSLVVGCAFESRAADAPAIQVLGKGAQIYACQPTGTVFAWRLKGPDAVLLDSDGKEVGRHFAGPSWQALDGSTIVGEPLAASPSPQAGSIPWLVLRVKSTVGAGLFANVAYIARTSTQGGAPPATGCDAVHSGVESRSSYSAVYTFFPAPKGMAR
jgi:hypothetical protein